MEKISVIVPVYNVEKYLDRCIESIVNQTYKNLEIILVDDGSPDNCPKMCDEWAKKDERIKVIHKENGGQGEARNFGIKESTGDYIGFTDSDDVIAENMYERLLSIAKKTNADAVQCALLKFLDFKQTEFDVDNRDVQLKALTPVEAVSELLKDKITSTCPAFLLKKDLAKSVLFDLGIINEDVMWTYRICKNSNKTVLTNEVLYFYLQREGSTMNSAYSKKRFDALDADLFKADAIKKDFPELYGKAVRGYIGSCFYHYQTLCRLKKCDEYEEYKKIIHKRFCDADLNEAYKVTDLKYKVWYRLFIKCPGLTCKIRNILKIGL